MLRYTRRKFLTGGNEMKIPRRNGASRKRVGDVCSVDAARHPPFSTDARASQGQARSNPPERLGGDSLTSRYSRPRAIKMLEDRGKRASRYVWDREAAVSLFVRLTLRDRPRCVLSRAVYFLSRSTRKEYVR